jgi:hypothetical protein
MENTVSAQPWNRDRGIWQLIPILKLSNSLCISSQYWVVSSDSIHGRNHLNIDGIDWAFELITLIISP